MEDFPSNANTKRDAKVRPASTGEPVKAEDGKNIQRITTTEVVRRKKSLGKRFKETFVGGDAKGVWGYVMLDVLVPAAKDTITDAITQGVERMVFGESRGPRSRNRGHGNNGYVSYNRMSHNDRGWNRNEPQRDISRRARSSHQFDEIILESRGEAEQVLDSLFELTSKYQVATVADLYDLVGIQGNHTDNRWGWTDLRGAGVSQVRGGYLLNLPKSEQLD
jgi:hypothetical protein